MPIELPARIAFLKKIHLFHGLEEEEYVAMAEELQEEAVPKGGVVFQQGGKADNFYLIYGGSVRIVRRQNNKEIQLYPGMAATVMIGTKARTALDYLLGPIAAAFDQSFRQK